MNRLPASENKGSAYLDFDFIIDYIRILFLSDVRNYNRLIQAINRNNPEFHGLFKGIGEVEAAICVLNLRLTLPVHCTPLFIAENKIGFTDLIHPLLDTPVSNSGEMANSSLLTGSNASGKSTFVKSLALGGVLAQTLYTVAASRFELRFSWIITSMVMRDDIYGGDSYFIVEMKSLRRMLDRVRDHPCTCYIDEILRGTNTVERIAASASMLGWLGGQNCLCIAASHDIELTHLLAASYDNYHFREQVTPTGVMFDYKLKTGPSTTRNAIKLLELMAFDPEIVTRAQELARGYDENQRW
jgi:DNA mismatch repair ATPase MutS